MAHNIKAAKISQILNSTSTSSLMKYQSLRYNKLKNDVELHFDLPSTTNLCDLQKNSETEIREHGKNKICVAILPKKSFLSEVVDSIHLKPTAFWRDSPILKIPKQTVLVEFSSPNIAKPFHMGHFRSTIIGNFVSNLMSSVGHNVVKINYLGDWGTQFGLLHLGLQLKNISDDEIAKDPIKVLYESYVFANKEVENNPDLQLKARQIFNQLEVGNFSEKDRWEKIRQYTIKELERTYDRLGVSFDEYQWESMFSAKEVASVIDELAGLLQTLPDGKRVVKLDEKRNVTLVKSDGSTLYLTRDVAAAKYRYKKHKFDQLMYVVENGQGDHFVALKHILEKMDLPWGANITHVKFGRIHGMSTRKGEVVFLKDILDEASDLARQRQGDSKNTRTNNNDESANSLGLSAVILNDLKQRRQRDYTFNWDKALQMQGDGGIKLQYTHCRLCSLEEQNVEVAKETISDFLMEPAAVALITELGRFDEILISSYNELESCILVNYLFNLSNHINQAFKHLRVKDQTPEIATQRLRLFVAARRVLGEGLKILGIKPLEKM